MIGGEGEPASEGIGGVHHREKPYYGIADDYIEHKVIYAEIRMLVAKTVDFSH